MLTTNRSEAAMMTPALVVTVPVSVWRVSVFVNVSLCVQVHARMQ